MPELRLQLQPARAAFAPGDEISGEATWKLDHTPPAVELRLFWFTRGDGTQDVGLVDTVKFDHPQIEETRPFQLRLPDGPYSYTGKYIAVAWALELLAPPAKNAVRMEFTLGPAGHAAHGDSDVENATNEDTSM